MMLEFLPQEPATRPPPPAPGPSAIGRRCAPGAGLGEGGTEPFLAPRIPRRCCHRTRRPTRALARPPGLRARGAFPRPPDTPSPASVSPASRVGPTPRSPLPLFHPDLSSGEPVWARTVTHQFTPFTPPFPTSLHRPLPAHIGCFRRPRLTPSYRWGHPRILPDKHLEELSALRVTESRGTRSQHTPHAPPSLGSDYNAAFSWKPTRLSPS